MDERAVTDPGADAAPAEAVAGDPDTAAAPAAADAKSEAK